MAGNGRKGPEMAQTWPFGKSPATDIDFRTNIVKNNIDLQYKMDTWPSCRNPVYPILPWMITVVERRLAPLKRILAPLLGCLQMADMAENGWVRK